MIRKNRRSILSTRFIIPLATYDSLPVYAQVLEELVVTAQKHVETAQNIPLTINVVEGTQLDSLGIRRLSSILL